MDLKTLKHLEEQVKKGRDLVYQIGQLKHFVERLKEHEIKRIDFMDNICIRASVENQVVSRMVNACIQVALEEINRLEQELAEL